MLVKTFKFWAAFSLNTKKMKRLAEIKYKAFPSDFMKNQVCADLKRREKKAYEKLDARLKEGLLPMKSKRNKNVSEGN